jgi:PEGA domain
VTPLRRTAARSVCAAALTVLLVPVEGNAQSRQAVPRPVPARVVGHGGGYRGPAVHTSYYRNPYWYGYRPYYWGFYGGYYTYPFYFSVGFPCCGYAPYAYGYPYYPYGYPYDVSGSLRLQVTPREAEVFVDGYYAGTVDNFDGTFQRLHVQPGDHDLEVFLPGHRSYQQKVYLQPGKTFNVRHAMEPLGPGEAEPARPEGRQRPPKTSGSSQRPRPIAPPDRDAELNPDPSRASPSDFGSLALRVQPGDVNVTIDGEAWENSGDNERLIVQLGPGVHHVQIRKDGYRTYMTDINIRPGETTTLNVAMTPN